MPDILRYSRFDNYLDRDSDLRKPWCWIFNNLAVFAVRPDQLDPSFDDIIKDAGTRRLSTKQKQEYMEAFHLNERERIVVHQGGYIIGHQEGMEEGDRRRALIAARKMKAKGLSYEDIAEGTDLSIEEIASL